jgi:pimeloyl-ACP methyl ester carboxylesterase
MRTITSKDGTQIAYEQTGQGPNVIVVLGAFNDRSAGEPLAQALAQHFTVYNYDRRGRGESLDTLPYAIEREIEDLNALINAAGGSASIFGYSSGAILALRAAAYGLSITRLALYEPPPTSQRFDNLALRLSTLIKDGKRGDAVELFQVEAVGIPVEYVIQMRYAPFRPTLEKMAHTLVYEAAVLTEVPANVLTSLKIPTLVMVGGNSPAVMLDAAHALVNQLPGGQYLSLEGQSHDIVPAIIAPELEKYLRG